MALKGQSLFLYGYQVTEINRSLDFRAASGGPVIMATLTIGYYSLSSLLTEIARAMQAVDSLNRYTGTVDRTYSGGTENRVTISTTGTYLDLLFSSGPRVASSCAPLIGFNATDYTGATSYSGSSSSGTTLLTSADFPGYSYTSPNLLKANSGVRNLSSSGKPEAVVFSEQRFWELGFKYIEEDLAESAWSDFLSWCCKQRRIEFTPDVLNPTVFYNGTLESTDEDANGMGFRLKEMLSDNLPGVYDTGILKFRVIE